jgi:glycosyltransferase involved in cell wall biosynthesis
MKILIISHLFAPSNSIGSVRPTKFAKYLEQFGHEVTVITGKNETNYKNPSLGRIEIHRIDNGLIIKKIQNKVNHVINIKQINKSCSHENKLNVKKYRNIERIRSQIKILKLYVYDLIQNIDWVLQCKKNIVKQYRIHDYEVVISSFGPIGSLLLGNYIKKKRIAHKWIADFRDNMHNEKNPNWLNKLIIWQEKKIIKLADLIIMVSKGQKEMLTEAIKLDSNLNGKIAIITNGFDTEEIIHEQLNISKKDILKIGYTGSLYNGQRDMSMLFQALSELIYEGEIPKDMVQVHYAGKESNIIYNQASIYQMSGCIVDHGYISRNEALKLQRECDLLIVLSWNTLKEKGILTGKFFEYLKEGKLIIALISGELPNSELAQIINDLNIGVACEYANEKEHLLILKKYLSKQYKMLSNGVVTNFTTKIEDIKQFHYKELTKKLENLCFNLMNKTTS